MFLQDFYLVQQHMDSCKGVEGIFLLNLFNSNGVWVSFLIRVNLVSPLKFKQQGKNQYRIYIQLKFSKFVRSTMTVWASTVNIVCTYILLITQYRLLLSSDEACIEYMDHESLLNMPYFGNDLSAPASGIKGSIVGSNTNGSIFIIGGKFAYDVTDGNPSTITANRYVLLTELNIYFNKSN